MQKSIYLFYVVLMLNLSIPGLEIIYAQHFEGEILFVRETPTDTSYFSYKIKGNKVRYEEMNRQMQVENYLIADLSNKNLFTVNPKMKLYRNIQVYPWRDKGDTLNFRITKTGNYKLINGYKCYQWRVLNRKENTEMSYWLATDQFRFFSEFMKMLNPSDKTSHYYLTIPGTRNILPLESVERSMLREMRMRTGVVSIVKKSLQANLFEIPSRYKMFQNK
jgi:hypothetical protein